MNRRIAIVQWYPHDEISLAISHELVKLGHQTHLFRFDGTLPTDIDLILTFAPYGDLLPIPMQLLRLSASSRPIFIHWNTEGLPDPRLPWSLVYPIARFRSLLCRLRLSGKPFTKKIFSKPPLSYISHRMHRFRYLGDYYWADRKGLIDLFFEISAVHGRLFKKHQLSTTVVPWGSVPTWYSDLGLKRDIDVLWMGKRGSLRRQRLLSRLREELESNGINMYVADNFENPFIFGKIRTEFLNRAKITINLLRTWHDDNLFRFPIVMSNRSLLISEPVLDHCPIYKPGTHYVSVPVSRMAQSIRYYLREDSKREEIVENAYQLVTQEMTLQNSIKTIMKMVDCHIDHP